MPATSLRLVRTLLETRSVGAAAKAQDRFFPATKLNFFGRTGRAGKNAWAVQNQKSFKKVQRRQQSARLLLRAQQGQRGEICQNNDLGTSSEVPEKTAFLHPPPLRKRCPSLIRSAQGPEDAAARRLEQQGMRQAMNKFEHNALGQSHGEPMSGKMAKQEGFINLAE
ncbi:hypothetical protein NDU88_004654 [Pleurodeles waltl]|uniref:Uncharacterized protein n=1 Tax=Pleurodeles waltl TaxID=8319 RepID=A0AAV7T8J0_PLEWA|nr:hypothetical protein NDU88_004654 [Pleurodeles waltl]